MKVGAFIFEIARSEIGYTKQRPLEYAAVCLAAAVREGFQGPVFIQGDHFQLVRKNFLGDPAAETNYVKGLIKEAVEAGIGISIVSKLAVRKEVEDGRLKLVKLKEGRILRTLSLIRSPKTALSHAAEEFLLFVRKYPYEAFI